jgi:hypothetical protein
MAFIDFILADESLSISLAYFEAESRVFIRIYSHDEIRALFTTAGLEIIDIIYPLVLGEGAGNITIRRALVAAIKRG